MKNLDLINRTTCVTTVINKIETVIEKSRDSLLEEDIKLLEECIIDLKSLQKIHKLPTPEQLMFITRIVINLLRFLNVNVDIEI